jgi:hypothetical protein
MRAIIAAGFGGAVLLLASPPAAEAGYAVCGAQDNIRRQYVVCSPASCRAGDVAVFSSAGSHPACGNDGASAQASRACGRHWSSWQPSGRAIPAPCPAGCKAERKVREQTRTVRGSRAKQHRELWQCSGSQR